MSLWSRLRNVFRGDAVNRELDEEMASHVEEAIANGRSPDEARRAFGNALREREKSRDVKLLPWLESLRADTVFGWRQLVKHRTVTIAAVLSLGLGIGACTTAFRLIDAVLFRPLPVAEPHRLYYLTFGMMDRSGKKDTADSFSYPLYRELRDAARDVADVLLISYAGRQDITYRSDAEMEKAYRQLISGNALSVLGLKPVLGRLLTPADDRSPGCCPVAVITHQYWQRRLGGDPKVVGRTFRIGDAQYEIVGVLPPGFTGTETGSMTDFFIPAMTNKMAINEKGWSWTRVWVKPRPGQSAESVRPLLQTVFTNDRYESSKDWPKDMAAKRREAELKSPITLESASAGASGTQRQYRQPLLILAAMVSLVLLIACANVANLLTAQATGRAREMALRVSIGAGRARLLQLLLVEGALLSVLSLGLGSLFAWWSAPRVVAQLNPPDNPMRLALHTDWRLAAFAVGLTFFVTVLFGLVPAWRASHVKPISALKGGEEIHHRQRLMHSLVAAQVAFCFLVHFVAGLFVSTFDRLTHQPLGFTAENVLLLETMSRGPKHPQTTWYQVASQLANYQGVEEASASSWALLGGSAWRSTIKVPNQRPDDEAPYFLSVSPTWLRTMKIGLVEGRDFRQEDKATVLGPEKPPAEGVAIVNEEFAHHYFPGQNVIGKSFQQSRRKEPPVATQIVGVVRDARYRDLREPIRPVVYVPLQEMEWGTFHIRTKPGVDLRSLTPALRAEVSRWQPQLRVSNTNTQAELVANQTLRERLLAMLSLFFALIALLLAGVGLYGVLNYSVVQRTREIGIRMALGAKPSNIARRVGTEVMGMLVMGSLAGMLAGIATERYVKTLLFEVSATDPAMVLTPALILLTTAIVAALAPTLRAIRIDPAQALRAE